MVMRGKKHWLSWVFEIGIVTEVLHKKVENIDITARPQNMRTVHISRFELGPNIFEIHRLYADLWGFNPKLRDTQNFMIMRGRGIRFPVYLR